jgi:hypothetical protein
MGHLKGSKILGIYHMPILHEGFETKLPFLYWVWSDLDGKNQKTLDFSHF